MTLLATTRTVDLRRVGVLALDVVRLPLTVAARLAEADRALRPMHRLLVLGADLDGVDVTLADRRGAPVWMGALPTEVDVAGVATGLPAERSLDIDDRRRTLGAAMSGVGFAQRTTTWFHWQLIS